MARAQTATHRVGKSGRGKNSAVRRKAGQMTVGELIVAAYDTVGNEVKDVAKLLASPDLSRAIHRRIVLVQ